MHRILAPIFALLACACATTAGYEKILDSWIGADETALVRQWGPPLQTQETGGAKLLTYSQVRDVYMPGAPATYTTQVGGTTYTTAVGPPTGVTLRQSCQTTFEISGGKVTRWQWHGNNCVAAEK